MMKRMNKTFLGAAILGAVFSVGGAFAPLPCAGVALAAETQLERAESEIDWTRGENSAIYAIGVGRPPADIQAGGIALARRAAIVDAQRRLVEIIKGVQIDADTLMQDLIIQSDTVKTRVSAAITGAQIVDEGTNADGSYYVRMRVPLYGASQSLAAALPELGQNGAPLVPPEASPSQFSQEDIRAVRSMRYTGVIIDASGLGLAPTFSPVLYDTDGRAVYGVKNVSSDVAIARGMVGYSDTLDDAAGGGRAGDNPLIVRAESVRGGKNSANPVNAVISVEDADRILLANQSEEFLPQGAVVFVK